MQNKTLMMKLIAVILVLMLSLSNFLVLVSYAAEISFESDVDLTSQNAKTNNKNIEFDSYFIENGNKTYSAQMNTDGENKVYLNFKLSNKGYLKAGIINFEEESFKIKKQEELVGTIQGIDYEKNEIMINQINSGTEVELEIPIEIEKSEIYNVQKLDKNNKVLFEGTYITEKGKEIKIEKELFLGLKWNADLEGKLEQSLSKYIENIEGKTLVEFNLKSYIENNKMPIKETVLEIDAPKIEDKLPEYVKVVGVNNFEYNKDEEKIQINIQNLTNEQSEIIWNEGIQELKLILVYDELSDNEKTVNLISKASFDVYGKNEKIEKLEENEIILNENIGNINELYITSDRAEMYKSFMYVNSEYETEYTMNWNLNVGYAKLTDKIIILDTEENFINNIEKKIEVNENSYYKQTIINKRNFEEILGQDGFIKIYNEANEEIENITLNITEDENIVINYQNYDLSKIKVEISKPQTEGYLGIKHVKAIKAKTNFEKEQINEFVKLENEVNLNTIYNKVIEEQETQEISIENIDVKNGINLLEPETKVEIKTNKDVLVTGSINEDIEIYISLINNEEKYNLFTNPIIDIKLPREIDYVKVKDIRFAFEEELNVKNTELIEDENGIKHIIVHLEGTQTKYNIENIITGASLNITADMSLKEIEESRNSELQLICKNGDTEVNAKTDISLIKVEIPEFESEENEPEIEQEQEQENQIEEEVQDNRSDEEIENNQTEEEQDNQTEEEVQNINNEFVEQDSNKLNSTIVVKSDKGNDTVLKWGEIVTYSITVKNYGETLRNAKIIIDLPEGLTYMAEEEAFEPLFYEENNDVKTIKWNLEEVLVGEEITKEFKAIVNKDVDSIEISAKVLDNERGKEAKSNLLINECDEGAITAQLVSNKSYSQISCEDTFTYEIKIKEFLGKILSNVNVELKIPDGIVCSEAYILENGSEIIKDNISINGNDVLVKIDNLQGQEEKHIILEMDAKNINNINDKQIKVQGKITADDIQEVLTNELVLELSKPVLEIKSYSNLENNEVNSVGVIKHFIEIKNTGIGTAKGVMIEDNFSDGIEHLNTIYHKKGQIIESKNYSGNRAMILTDLEENETMVAMVTVKTLGINNVENFIKVSADGIETITTEKQTYKVKETSENIENIPDNDNNLNNNSKELNILGYVWLDNNKNGIKEVDEENIANIETWLINRETNEQVKILTNSNGEYQFGNLKNGSYMLIFVYDNAKYSLTKPFVNNINEDLVSKGVRGEAQINGETRVIAVIENINIQDNNISNLNVGLIRNEIFDLSLNKVVDSIEVKTNKGIMTQSLNKKFAKVEIHSKEINGAEVKIRYRFDIKNEGDIEGSIKKIVEDVPEGMSINLDENADWKLGEDGKLYNNSLSKIRISSGDTRSVYLTLTKVMTEDNTGLINNIAEIGESYNEMNIKDNDSVEGNNKQNEDDISVADVYIGIKTGRTMLYISLALSMLIVLSTGIYMINKKVLQ